MKVSKETHGSLMIFEEILIKGLLKGVGKAGARNKPCSKLEPNESNYLKRDPRQKRWLSSWTPASPNQAEHELTPPPF